MQNVEGTKKRFFSSFIGNIIRSAFSLITGLILARWLGPSEYGRMSFLISSFTAFRTLTDLGTSSAFFTFLSQKKRSYKFITYFWKWILFQFLFTAILICFLLPQSIINELWKSEDKLIILLAMISTFVQGSIWPIASQMAEANRKTYKLQFLNTFVVIVNLIVIIFLYKIGKLAIPLIFISLFIEWSIASLIASKLYNSKSKEINNFDELKDTSLSVFREFFKYCLPFIPYTIFSFFHDFLDRWMLQKWGGAVQQGYYTISYQFATISLLATTSILRIFWKEIAEASYTQNHQRVNELYLKVSRGLYFFGAISAGALIPWTQEIIEIMLGKDYLGAKLTMMLMFFYPVHQSIGQIGSSMLLATGKTKIQVILGIVFMAASILVTFFVLAPKDYIIPGLGLSSIGLAWKMVLMQIIQVNVLLLLISRNFQCKYDWKFQFYGLIPPMFIGIILKFIIFKIYFIPVYLEMGIFALVYAFLIVVLVNIFPSICGISGFEIKQYKLKFFN